MAGDLRLFYISKRLRDRQLQKKPKNGFGERHLQNAGICFEALEPRLLLSGSWGAVVDAPGPDTPFDAHGGLAQGTVMFHSDASISGAGNVQVNLTPASGRVDLLSRAPALNTLGTAVLALDASSGSIPADPVAEATISTPLADNKDNALQSDILAAALRRELVLVNDNVADHKQLVTDLQGRDVNRIIEIVVLDAHRDGIQQVSDILAERSDLAAVHVITHGSEGQINLGNTYLNSATLQQNSDAVANWGSALTDTGDILFYGCNIAADSVGQSLLGNIADMTGAEIAASDDLTGHAGLGGDWVLEYHAGAVEAVVGPGRDAQQAWNFTLAPGIELNNDGGNDDYLISNSGLPQSLTATTVEIRFAASTTYTPEETVFMSFNNAAGDEFSLQIDDPYGNLELDFGNGVVQYSTAINYESLLDGNTHTLSVTWDNTLGGWSVYVDGGFIESGTGLNNGVALDTMNGQFVFGQEQDSPDGGYDALQYFSGTLYDVRIWDSVRSAAEIALNYETPFDPASLPGGLLANWQMDGFNGANEVVDVVNGNNLTLHHVDGAGFTNDAPVLAGANDLASITENLASGSNAGTLVSDLISGQVTDADAGAASGIAVVSVDNTNGTWQFTTDGGTVWTDFGTPGTSTARLLAAGANTAVRFVPDADWSGTVTNGITFHAWDQTAGTAGATADLTSLSSTQTIFDQFNAVFYGSDDGSINWTNDWQELGEADGPALGGTRVNAVNDVVAGPCLEIDLSTLGAGVSRQADLSSATSATLSFTYEQDTTSPGGELVLEVFDGIGWNLLQTYTVDSDFFVGPAGVYQSFDISGYTHANTEIRFRTTEAAAGDKVFIDDIQIAYTRIDNVGGTTAYSAATAGSSITVTPANDAPVLDLDGSDGLAGWYDADWQYRFTVTVDPAQVSTDLTDFSLLITGDNVAPEFWSHVKADGSDIVVTAGDGTTRLDRDLIELDTPGQRMVLRARVPLLSSTSDTVLCIYYGNASASEVNDHATYGSALEVYLPLHEDPSGPAAQMQDRTDGGWDGTSTGSMSSTDVVAGKVGDALEFDGVDDRIETAVVNHGIGTGDFTFLAWVQRLSDTGQQYQGTMSNGDYYPAMYVEQNGSDTWGGYWGSAKDAGASVADGSWYLLCMRRDSGTISFLKDGQLEALSYPVGTSMPDDILRLGSSSATSANHGHQTIDEARVYSRALSDDELTTIYNNESDPSAFCSTGSQSSAVTFTEDGGPVAVTDADATLSDVDDVNLTALTVTITNPLDGISEILAANTGGTSIAASYDSGTGVLTLSGPDSVANYQQVLRTITYDNTSQNPQTEARLITVVANDGTDDSNVAATLVTIVAMNDAPTASGGPYNLGSTSEDTTSAGTRVSTILGGLASDDVDGDTLGLAVTTASGNGTWQYSTDATDGTDGNWTDFGSVADDGALLLSNTSWVRYAPDGSTGEAAGLTFRAWDGSTGSASALGTPSTADTADNGGISAFSSATAVATLTVTDANDAPVLDLDGSDGLAGWYDADWQYRFTVTVDPAQVSTDLTDFSLLITGDNVAPEFWSHVKADGSDIVVTAGDGTTRLDRDLIELDTPGQRMVLRARVPLLSSTSDTVLCIYYGNASASEVNDHATYGSALEVYLPLHEDPSGPAAQMQDRTDGGWDGTSTGSMSSTDVVAGKVGDALEFDGVDDRVETAVVNHGIGTGDFTFLAWVQRLSDTGQPYQGTMSNGDYSPAMYVEQNGSDTWGGYWGNAKDAGASVADGSWYLLCMRRDSGTISFLKDGQLEALSYPVGTSMPDDILRLGSSSATSANHGHQTIDEARVYSRALSDDELTTIYNNESDPSAFCSTGSQSSAVTFTEDGGPVAVTDADATLSDVDDVNLTALTVTITNPLDGISEILAANTGGTSIAASYDSGTGVLTLSGPDSVANYQQVLRTITYDNTSQNPQTEARLITVVANDGTDDSNVAATLVTIVAMNDAPTAADATIIATENTVFNGTLPVATDADGDAVSYSLGTDAAIGTAVVNGDGSFSYTPAPNTIGADSFTYTVSDGNGGSNTYSVNVDVVAPNNAPLAVADNFTVNEGSTTHLNLALNDSDADDGLDLTSINIVDSPSNGSILINNDGTVDYTHDGSETVSDSFTYTINDLATATSNTVVVSLAITPVNDIPVVAGVNTGAVTKNDDPDADGLLAVSGALTISDPDAAESSFQAGTVVGAYGSLTIDAAGNWNYAADNTQAAIQQLNAGESISDVLTVTTADGTTHSVIVTINGATAIVGQGGGEPGPGFEIDPIEPDPEPDPELPPDEILPVEDELPPREELAISDIPSSKLPVITPLQWVDPTYFVPTISLLTTDNGLPTDNGSPSGVASIVKYLQRELASQTIARFAPNVSALFSTEAMTQTLDHIQQQLGDTLAMDGKRGQLIIGAATGLGVSVFAGYVIWAFRGSSLLLGALTAMPMWRCFDPLPVLMGNDKKRRDRDEAKSTQHDLDKDETTGERTAGRETSGKAHRRLEREK